MYPMNLWRTTKEEHFEIKFMSSFNPFHMGYNVDSFGIFASIDSIHVFSKIFTDNITSKSFPKYLTERGL